jgi:tetratricopeptide (TPR) repeat protein
MTTPLPITISGRVERLCAEGEAFAAQQRYAAAALRFTTAFRLLPRPQDRWSVTPRLLAAMVDICFAAGDLESARHAALAALDCPDVNDNPALRMKLGAIYFEEGNLEAARAEFALALSRGGREVFDDEDPKYWDFAARCELN